MSPCHCPTGCTERSQLRELGLPPTIIPPTTTQHWGTNVQTCLYVIRAKERDLGRSMLWLYCWGRGYQFPSTLSWKGGFCTWPWSQELTGQRGWTELEAMSYHNWHCMVSREALISRYCSKMCKPCTGSPVLRETALEWVPPSRGTLKPPMLSPMKYGNCDAFPMGLRWTLNEIMWVRFPLQCRPTINVRSLATLLLPSV